MNTGVFQGSSGEYLTNSSTPIPSASNKKRQSELLMYFQYLCQRKCCSSNSLCQTAVDLPPSLRPLPTGVMYSKVSLPREQAQKYTRQKKHKKDNNNKMHCPSLRSFVAHRSPERSPYHENQKENKVRNKNKNNNNKLLLTSLCTLPTGVVFGEVSLQRAPTRKQTKWKWKHGSPV